MSDQGRIAEVLGQYAESMRETSPLFKTPEELVELVDLSVSYSPVLLHGQLIPKTCVKLGNSGKYAIYDTGYPHANMGNHKWNVPEKEVKLHRARFLLQRDIFFQDLMMRESDQDGRKSDPDAPRNFRGFRYYTGAAIYQPTEYEIVRDFIPKFLGESFILPKILLEQVKKNYVYADGTIEVIRLRS